MFPTNGSTYSTSSIQRIIPDEHTENSSNSLDSNPSLISSQLEFENARKQLEMKDRMIQMQINTISRLTVANDNLSKEVNKKNEELQAKETATAALESRVHLLAQEVQRYRLAQVQPVPETIPINNAPTTSWWRKLGRGIKNGFSAVGRFCKNNAKLCEAGIGIAGIILSICFPPYSIPILLSVGAGIALFEWAIK